MALIKPKLLRVSFSEKEVKVHPPLYKLNLDLNHGRLNDHDCSCGCTFVVPQGYIAFVKKDSTLDKEMIRDCQTRTITDPPTRLPLFSRNYSKPDKKNGKSVTEKITIYLFSKEIREMSCALDDSFILIITCHFSEQKVLDNISIISDNLDKYPISTTDINSNGSDLDIILNDNSTIDEAILDRIENKKTSILEKLDEKEGDNPILNARECLELILDDDDDNPLLKILSFAELTIQKVARKKEEPINTEADVKEDSSEYNPSEFLEHINKPDSTSLDKKEGRKAEDVFDIIKNIATDPTKINELSEKTKGDASPKEVVGEPVEKYIAKPIESTVTPVAPLEADSTSVETTPAVKPITSDPTTIVTSASAIETPAKISPSDEDSLSLSELTNSSSDLRRIKEAIRNSTFNVAQELIADYFSKEKANTNGEKCAALWLRIHIRNTDKSLKLEIIAFRPSINALVLNANDDIPQLLNVAPKTAKSEILNYFFILLKTVVEPPLGKESKDIQKKISQADAWVKLFGMIAAYYDEGIEQMRDLAIEYIHEIISTYKDYEVHEDDNLRKKNTLNNTIKTVEQLALCSVYGLKLTGLEGQARRQRNDEIARIITSCKNGIANESDAPSYSTIETASSTRGESYRTRTPSHARPRTPTYGIPSPEPIRTPPRPRGTDTVLPRRGDPRFSDSRLADVRSTTPPRPTSSSTHSTATTSETTPSASRTPRIHEHKPRTVVHTPVLRTASVSDDLSDKPHDSSTALSGLTQSRFRDRYYTSIVFIVLAFILSLIATIRVSAFTVVSFISSLLALIVSAIIHPKVSEYKYLKKVLSPNWKKILYIGIPVTAIIIRIILLVVECKNGYDYLGGYAYTSILVLLIIALVLMLIGGAYHISSNNSRDHRRSYSFYRVPVKIMSSLSLTIYTTIQGYLGNTIASIFFVSLIFIAIYIAESLIIGFFGLFNKSGKQRF